MSNVHCRDPPPTACSAHAARMTFFGPIFRPPLGTPKKSCYFGPRGLLEPSYTFSVPNLPPQRLPKSMFLGFQEVTYVGRRKNLTILSPPTRKPLLNVPRATQNRPKINEKSVPREIAFNVHFEHPLKSPLGALPGHLKIIFKHKVKI